MSGDGRRATKRLLAVARGDEPADVVFAGGRVVNVFTGEVEETDLAVAGDRVAGLGSGYEGRETVDAKGAWLAPGFLDAHVHIESSLVTPREFARAVVPRGTTTAVTDPHEIANVHGLEGIRYMLGESEGLPLQVLVMASSCVPATPMGTAGAELGAGELEELKDHPRVVGLAELMNFPGAIHGDDGVLEKLQAYRGRPVDGHAPGVRGRALNAYAAAGPGSDHECTEVDEAREKLGRGLYVFLREATNARNLEDLLPALTPENRRRAALCTDDRQPPDLLDEGGIDAMIRTCIAHGLEPVEAIRLATLNPAEHFGLRDRGGLAPGRRADIVVLDDLEELGIREVWCGGRPASRDGQALAWSLPAPPPPPEPRMEIPWETLSLRIEAREGEVRVIRAIPDQLVTECESAVPRVVGGEVVADPERDLLKIAVLERHRGTGRVGLGLVRGLGLRRGAIAGTVAHDHHNLIAAGAGDGAILRAARAVAEVGGGLAVATEEEVRALLPLPVGGLMAREPVEEVRRRLDDVLEAARGLGSPLHDPFMALSFLGLEVIPALKITDQGLVDVTRFERVGLWVGGD